MTPDELRTKATAMRVKANRLTEDANRASANAPGSYVTGGSGRSRAQNRATWRALEKTIDNAVAACKLRRYADRLDANAQHIENAPRREAVKVASKEAERRSRAQVAVLPLVNDPAASWHMTSAEWASIHRDYKSITRSGLHRERFAMRNSVSETVYLTDKPVKVVLP